MTSKCERCECDMHPADAALSELCRKCEKSCRDGKGKYLTIFGRHVIRSWDRHAEAAASAARRHFLDPDEEDPTETPFTPEEAHAAEFDNPDANTYADDYQLDEEDDEIT